MASSLKVDGQLVDELDLSEAYEEGVYGVTPNIPGARISHRSKTVEMVVALRVAHAPEHFEGHQGSITAVNLPGHKRNEKCAGHSEARND